MSSRIQLVLALMLVVVVQGCQSDARSPAGPPALLSANSTLAPLLAVGSTPPDSDAR